MIGKPLGSRETGGTYEAATTRKFKKGRTEAIRVVSNPVRLWIDAMSSSSSNDESKKRLLADAAKQHIVDAKDAGNAMGIDRHLFGLRLLVQESDGGTLFLLFFFWCSLRPRPMLTKQ